jgi:hypothetical protein
MRRTLCALVSMLAFAAPAAADNIRVTFDNILGPGSISVPASTRPFNDNSVPGAVVYVTQEIAGGVLHSDGFSFNAFAPLGGLTVQDSRYGEFQNGYPSNGTAVLWARGEETDGIVNSARMQIRSSDGGLFKLLDMELAALPRFAGGANQLRITGFRGGLAAGMQLLLVGSDDYKALHLAKWGLLDSLLIEGQPQGPSHFILDNVRVHRVPEPQTLFLVGLGIAALFLPLATHRSRRLARTTRSR